jgi:hypothetical protein
MTQRKLKPWMRHERVFIWIATIVTFLIVAGACEAVIWFAQICRKFYNVSLRGGIGAWKAPS